MRKATECYLFNPYSFYKGHPSQEALTRELCSQIGTSDSYDSFCVYDPESDDYQFLDWNDPLAQRIWCPFVSDGLIVNAKRLFEEEEYSEEDLALIRDREQLFEYFDAEDDAAEYSFGSDDSDDPLSAARHAIDNVFFKSFQSDLDKIVWNFIAEKSPEIGNPSDETFSMIATDVSTIQLQTLAKQPPPSPMALTGFGPTLAKAVYEEMPLNQRFKYRILNLRYLDALQKSAKNIIRQDRALDTALNLLDRAKVIIHQDDDDFDKFIELHFPNEKIAAKAILDKYHLSSKQLDKMAKFFETTTVLQYSEFSRGRPESPTFSIGSTSSQHQTRQRGKQKQVEIPYVYEDDFVRAIISIIAYILFRGKSIVPSKAVGKIIGIKISNRFIHTFREKYGFIFFGQDYSDQIDRSIDIFLEKWLNINSDQVSFSLASEDDDFVVIQ